MRNLKSNAYRLVGSASLLAVIVEALAAGRKW
jgi:hypothetical protein